MNLLTKKYLVKFLKYGEPATDFLSLFVIFLFLYFRLPIEFFSGAPATGGDTGSHFWPLVTLTQYSLPHWQLYSWNPGNLGGEPQLVHYFPLPFIIMAAFSTLLPLGLAFNVGTILPAFLLPVAVYLCFRGLGARFPVPILGSIFVQVFLYNESYSMWGGNILSLLAGQFAHLYALCFLLLGLGAFVWELRRSMFPFLSVICCAGVAVSHAYVLLGLPILFFAGIIYTPYKSFRFKVQRLLLLGLLSALISLWFLVPMIDNAQWTTPFFMRWGLKNPLEKIFPEIYYPVLVTLIPALISIVFFTEQRRSFVLWVIPSIYYLAAFFVFPLIGLVDIRAFPQLEMFVVLLAAHSFGLLLRKYSRIFSWLLAFPICLLLLWWIDVHATKLNTWLKWNYRGWEDKELYAPLKDLSASIKGDFSEPRVIYEQDDRNNAAGTVRVFEMLPYFAHRSTLESVYMQATILAPYAFYLQAKISKTPSCPFVQFECPQFISSPDQFETLNAKFDLMGVGGLILLDKEIRHNLEEAKAGTWKGPFGPWHYLKLRHQPSLVQVIEKKPRIISQKKWKERFFEWFQEYDGQQALEVVDNGNVDVLINAVTPSNSQTCNPSLELDINRMHLHTDCPGKAHLLKISYHSTWKASSGDNLLLSSPGYIMIVPSKNDIEFEFGKSLLWQTSRWVSLLSGVLLIILAFRFYRTVEKQSYKADAKKRLPEHRSALRERKRSLN